MTITLALVCLWILLGMLGTPIAKLGMALEKAKGNASTESELYSRGIENPRVRLFIEIVFGPVYFVCALWAVVDVILEKPRAR